MRHRSLLWIALGLSLLAHVAFFAILVSFPIRLANQSHSQVVEMALVAKKPEPPVAKLVTPTPPPIEEARKVVSRRPRPNREIQPAQDIPPPAIAPRPVFGVTEESVVPGEAEVSVPVGNTLETEEREIAKTPPLPLPPSPPPSPTSSTPQVSDESISEHAKVLVEVKPEYPPIAKRLGIEGSVMLRVTVDRQGKVRAARIVKKAGYGMDEAALKAILSFIFSPARGARHEPVESTFNYEVRFQQFRAQ